MIQEQYLYITRHSSLKTALKRIPKSLRRVLEGGLILFFFGQLVIRGLQFSIHSGQLLISGVPCSIIFTFLRDRVARRAYFRQDGKTLHDRLYDLGIEEQIKDFYRPQIFDEAELDRYIHQILYDRTGYIGRDYRANAQGLLVLKRDQALT
jgi:hypothetical protein